MSIDPVSLVTLSDGAAVAPVAPVAPIGSSSGSAAADGASTPPLLGSGSAASTPDGSSASGGSPPTPGETRAAVASANRQLAESGREFSFHYDDQVHQEIVKIIDTRTNQVLQQIPSEAMLAAARALAGGTTSGLLLKTEV
ncbi:MAG TPA: flagellar protein FlaG [Burkholderiaceae bacterium]|nr:flagellar protein FlaG [Burkholderiaceae bacterium]